MTSLKCLFVVEQRKNVFLKLLFKFHVRELNNSMTIPLDEVVIQEERDKHNNIIFSDSELLLILPTQIKKMSEPHKIMCGCERCMPSNIMNSYLLIWCGFYLNKIKG